MASQQNIQVSIVMGSISDWDKMKPCEDILKSFKIPCESKVVSAHRTPDRLYQYATTAQAQGVKIIIAAAGGAAHLPGMIAALTTLPVLGVPVKTASLKGVDSLLSIMQMPAGIPVATLAVDGAKNAGLFASSPAQTRIMLLPQSTIGIVGGGQLGRMSALAAYSAGYEVVILTDDEASPAAKICPSFKESEPSQVAAFCKKADVITFEFEKVQAKTLDLLEASNTLLAPSARCIRLAQNRILEKEFINSCGIATAKWQAVHNIEEAQKLTSPLILKDALFGYDGKGQILWKTKTAPPLENFPQVAEEIIAFDKELSVITARNTKGEYKTFDVCENHHQNHILATTKVPADITEEIALQAQKIAVTLAEKMELVGLLTVEFFLTQNNTLLVNEFAPRPHNSGHWTNDGAVCSQFEQLIRAICDLPLAQPARLCDVKMTNLLGSTAQNPTPYLKNSHTKFWHYSKQPRPNRKVGHITELKLPKQK